MVHGKKTDAETKASLLPSSDCFVFDVTSAIGGIGITMPDGSGFRV